MIRVVNIFLCLCFLSSCSDLKLSSISYNTKLQPIYLTDSNNFADNAIIENLRNQFKDLAIATTRNTKNAKTIITIKDTKQATNKALHATSDSAYYTNEYSTILNITYPSNKKQSFKHKIAATEQISKLENQNTFNNSYASAELEHELVENIMLAILTNG